MGLHRAGFEVVGVDHRPQPHYPFTFVRADALAPPFDLSAFDLIWASPPCQAYTALGALHPDREHPDLVADTRALLEASGVPYIMENVMGAPLRFPVKLCGQMFDLGCDGGSLRRHRLFECSFLVLAPECSHGPDGTPTVGAYGHDPNPSGGSRKRERYAQRPTFTVDDAREAMGIDWMPMKYLSQAIPPAYSEYLARAFLDQQ